MSRTAPAAKGMTEAELQASIIDLARMGGWLIHHDRPARTPGAARGWRTAVEGHAGYPDLALARGGLAPRVLWLEVKGPGGRLTIEQQAWARVLGSSGDEALDWATMLAGHGRYAVARPQQWHDGKLQQLLLGRHKPRYMTT